MKKWADRILETIHPQDTVVKTVVYEESSTSQESSNEPEEEYVLESIRLTQEMLGDTLDYDDTAPSTNNVQIETEVDENITLDSSEVLEQLFSDYPGILLSKIFFDKSDMPRYHFYKNLEFALNLCDENGNLLVPCATYEMHMIKYKPENHDVTIEKIKETIKNSAIYNKIKL